MPPQTQILIADKIKAWAFPILLSVVSIFLYHFYQQQQILVDKLNDAVINQVHQAGQQDLMMYRLNQIDKQIDNLKPTRNGAQ
jgi:hypothetical protein